MNFENSKTFNSHRLLPSLSNEINLKRSDYYITLSNLRYLLYTENAKKLYNNNKLKTSTPV